MDIVIGPDGIVYSSLNSARGGKSPVSSASHESPETAADRTPEAEASNRRGSWFPAIEAPKPSRKKHRASRPFICGQCEDFATSSHDDLLRHKAAGHDESQNPRAEVASDSGFVSCTACRSQVMTKNLERHIRRSHEPPKPPKQKAPRRRIQIISGKGPPARPTAAWERNSRIGKEATPWEPISKAQRGPSASGDKAPLQPSSDNKSPATFICGVCHKYRAVSQRTLASHISTAHPRGPKTNEGSEANRQRSMKSQRDTSNTQRQGRVVREASGKQGSTKQVTREIADDVLGQGRRQRIDASPDGRLPREHGRFGSFSSHDGYGDEDWA
jgi:hypothetical protein